jgi:recombinational DNA repair protein RecR
MASQEIDALAQALSKLPGLGPRSARRVVLHLMKKRESVLMPLLRALEQVEQRLVVCATSVPSVLLRTYLICGRWIARGYFRENIMCWVAGYLPWMAFGQKI